MIKRDDPSILIDSLVNLGVKREDCFRIAKSKFPEIDSHKFAARYTHSRQLVRRNKMRAELDQKLSTISDKGPLDTFLANLNPDHG